MKLIRTEIVFLEHKSSSPVPDSGVYDLMLQKAFEFLIKFISTGKTVLFLSHLRNCRSLTLLHEYIIASLSPDLFTMSFRAFVEIV